MVISFEEKDRAAIETKGVTIIEYKRTLYRIYGSRKISIDAIKEGVVVLVDIIDKFSEVASLLSDAFIEVIDNVKFLAEKIIEVYHLPTLFRYKVVKFISRCTGIDIYRLWKTTRHTWLARSCC